jgi:GNAT superfamily N-acetyltransferase
MAVHAVTDLALSQRLERVEARATVAFVAARARHDPASGAAWCDVSGTYAMFDRVGSPSTQTFGLGLFAPPTPEDIAQLEAFFDDRGAETLHEVSPIADQGVLPLLTSRGYEPFELTSVMHRPTTLTESQPSAPELSVRRIEAQEAALYARTAAIGWEQSPEAGSFMVDFALVSARAEGLTCFIAEWNGLPIASGAMALHDGAALLAGASTIPEWRGRGAQGALLRARLQYAETLKCDLAVMGALPGSASQRNAERQGFRIAYTRIKWRRRRAV